MKQAVKLIVMGGSWGGLQASMQVLSCLPAHYPIPVVLVLHRLKNFESDLPDLYGKKLRLQVEEVEEKEALRGGYVYIAPANYHVLLEKDRTFSLDVSEYENYSRPSIDVTFASAAEVYGRQTAAILLSGASRDGSLGLKAIAEAGGFTVVQDLQEAEVDTMPAAARELVPGSSMLTLNNIQEFLLSLP